MRVTCGAKECLTCNPIERQVDRIERGLPPT
jgi:hypothetical protein